MKNYKAQLSQTHFRFKVTDWFENKETLAMVIEDDAIFLIVWWLIIIIKLRSKD